ncbi:MAG: hypothetical protein KatS3mg109_0151 [Pirellulaceae bacterium]|nr:MAG: hypothetical protein KatS3mg109_0151 [Pirellulaceae bacterium]
MNAKVTGLVRRVCLVSRSCLEQTLSMIGVLLGAARCRVKRTSGEGDEWTVF